MRRSRRTCARGALLALPLAIAASGGWAGDPLPEAQIGLELNALEQTGGGCRLTFVMRNGLSADIEALGLEIALFADDGAVAGIVALDAGALPAGKTRVRRFVAPESSCAQISRVLINDVTRCSGAELSPAACLSHLAASSRARAELVL